MIKAFLCFLVSLGLSFAMSWLSSLPDSWWVAPVAFWEFLLAVVFGCAAVLFLSEAISANSSK
jgi:hypothetical protein